MATKGSDAAFPRGPSNRCSSGHGMTLREYYAGQAMAGLLAGLKGTMEVSTVIEEMVAKTAVCNADALLAELEKGASDAE